MKPEKRLKCTYKSDGSWECSVETVLQKSSGNYNNLAQIMNDSIALDFSNSPNALLEDQLNIGSITLKSNDLPIATKTSTYQKYGQTIIAANSNELVNWLASYNGQADEIVITVNQLKFETRPGANTVVMEITQNGNVVAGTSESMYISPFSLINQEINTY